jgi:putative PEP-CTERM system TPR-repeat lipoprotein
MSTFLNRRKGLLLATTFSVLALSGFALHADISKSDLTAPSTSQSLDGLRAAEIRLRNEVDQSPKNGMLRVELAKVYRELGNYNAALAELTVARQLRTKDDLVAPVMAQTMAESGAFADLLRDVPQGSRPAKIESIVRVYRGQAQMAVGEFDGAANSLRDAERLDPGSVIAQITTTRLLLSQKQMAAAGKKIDHVLTIAPKDSAALELKGLILQSTGNAALAATFFNKALAADRLNIQALLDRANLEASRNQLDQAAKDLRIIKTVVPNSPMAAYVDAVVKARQGRYQEADEALNKLRNSMGFLPGAYFLAGEIKFKLNQMGQAEDYLSKFIAQQQNQPEAYEILGIIALKRGDTERAVTMLEKAHGLVPQDANTSVLLSQAYLAHGESDKAVALIDQAGASQPKNTAVEAQRALAHFAMGDPGGSLAHLNDLFKSGAGDLKAGPSLILAQLQAGKVGEAAATAQSLVKHDPANVLFQELLGATLVAQHNYAAAEKIFKTIMDKQPGLLAARRSLAQVYLSTNRTSAAIALFQDWIAKNPKDLKAKRALAEIDVSLKDYASAEKLLTDANVLTTGDVDSALQLVRVYELQKKWPDAIKAAQWLQGRFASNLAVVDTLGRLYSESGDTKASMAQYANAVSRFPKSAELWNNYATAQAAAKNFTGALDAISHAHALAADNLNYERSLVEMTYLVKGKDAALAVGQTFSSNTAQLPAYAIMTASAMERHGKHAEAVALLETTNAKAPSSAVTLILSKYYVGEKNLKKAIALMEIWIKSHPDDADARFGLAQLYGSVGAMPQALQQFEWLQTKRPTDSIVFNNLAWLYSQKNDPRAQAMAEKAYELSPKSGSVADTLGWILENKGDTAGGLKYLQQANQESPEDASVQYHFAYALVKANRQVDARALLGKVMNSNSAPPDIKRSAQSLLAKIGG